MKIVITVRELLNAGIWAKYCELRGGNVYAINEGLFADDDEITMTIQEAKQIGLTLESEG